MENLKNKIDSKIEPLQLKSWIKIKSYLPEQIINKFNIKFYLPIIDQHNNIYFSVRDSLRNEIYEKR